MENEYYKLIDDFVVALANVGGPPEAYIQALERARALITDDINAAKEKG